MSFGLFQIEMPRNEPVLSYAPGTTEREEIKKKLKEFKSKTIEIPTIIGGKEHFTGETIDIVMPHNHSHVLAKAHLAPKELLKEAIQVALEAKNEYLEFPWEERAALFMKAAELLSTTWRSTLNAATMLGVSKTVHQAEIDSAAELIDMLRFNTYWMHEIYKQQPISSKGVWNRLEYRPLDGFVLAITPFNFTSIAGNLPSAPAIMGNVVLWKPASSALYPAYYIMKLFQAAGLPPGVINFLPARGYDISEVVVRHPDLGGVHFTGSTKTFQYIWKTVGENIANYNQYPRLVGETGGKDFVFAHNSANIDALTTALIRGAYEYQGQKCSAASRAYIPKSIWEPLKEKLISELKTVKVGDPEDFTNFMTAVIDKVSFDKITQYIEHAKHDDTYEVIFGGNYDDSKGYFIDPTIILSKDPYSKLMKEEIFGPVLTVYVYEDEEYVETLKICDKTAGYGLTGAVFANDRKALLIAEKILRFTAGNYYRNDKPTGAVIAQQPFGGSRASGTNDKAGSYQNLLRWTSVRAIKENLTPPTDYRYEFMKKS